MIKMREVPDRKEPIPGQKRGPVRGTPEYRAMTYRYRSIAVRLTDEQLEFVNSLAAARGCTFAAVMRDIVETAKDNWRVG